jgi:fluoroacetyl-CoA thioesterase
MKDTLKPGIKFEYKFQVTKAKTVPSLYPESDEFLVMPEVFATGYMVGFLEWACVLAIKPHLDWPKEQSVGTYIDVTHEAATPPGLIVCAKVELMEIDGKRLTFSVEANDGVDVISKGWHQRYVIDKNSFEKRVSEKLARNPPN